MANSGVANVEVRSRADLHERARVCVHAGSKMGCGASTAAARDEPPVAPPAPAADSNSAQPVTRTQSKPANLKELFDLMDTDGSGGIDAIELADKLVADHELEALLGMKHAHGGTEIAKMLRVVLGLEPPTFPPCAQ